MLPILIAIISIGLIELFARAAGFGNFPLFELVDGSLYRFTPNQRGRFANKFSWQYDSSGMRSEKGLQSMSGVTLIVGDSVVDGGLAINQADTLCSRIADRTGDSTYPVACHGWSLANEILALTRINDWEKARCIVWVLNAGDIDFVNIPRNTYFFPRQRPRLLVAWLAARAILGRVRTYTQFPLDHSRIGSKDSETALLSMFANAIGRYDGHLLIVRYPMSDGTLPDKDFCAALVEHVRKGAVVELEKGCGWSAACYADHIHPNAFGISTLAAFIEREINRMTKSAATNDA